MHRRIIIATFLLLSAYSGFAQTSNSSENYKLVWEDSFNGNKINTKYWQIVTDGNSGGGNQELQYYHQKNIKVGKEPQTGEKCLIITAKKENFSSKKATSGKLTTQNKISFKYGKIEARIKLPKTENGLWPAFWLLGNNYPQTPWPTCGEIDIVEMGSKSGIEQGIQNRYFTGACHWGASYNDGKYPNYGKPTLSTYSLQEDFHLYTLIWDKKLVKMYLDLDKFPNNEPYYEMQIDGENVPDSPDNPAKFFHKQYFIIFNIAVGGTFPQITDIDNITALKNSEARMYIDFVRVYQKNIAEEEFTSVTSPK